MRVVLAVVFFMLAGLIADANCLGLDPLQPNYDGPGGRPYCSAHHRPLVRQHVFQLPGERMPTIHFEGGLQGVIDCNPNCLYPFASFRRSKKFAQPTVRLYCLTCERNVLAAVLRTGGD
jgi:hypothetical protein